MGLGMNGITASWLMPSCLCLCPHTLLVGWGLALFVPSAMSDSLASMSDSMHACLTTLYPCLALCTHV